MKRQSTKTKNEIFSCNPWFFWQECMFCNQEFRRERGYRFQLTRNADWDYACSGCCSSKHYCDLKVEEFKQRNRLRPTRTPSGIPNLPDVTCDVPMPKYKPLNPPGKRLNEA